MEIIDLTLPVGPELTPVPGHPPISLSPIQTHAEHGRSNTLFSTSLHCGTHIDDPYHFDPGGQTIDAIAIFRLIHKGVLVSLKGKVGWGEEITSSLIESSLPTHRLLWRRTVPILYTGWLEGHYATDYFYTQNPYLGLSAIQWLVAKEIPGVAVDFPVDASPDYPAHRGLLTRGILIIENLANLHLLPPQGFTLYALPLKIKAGDGAPARVFALLD